MLTDPPTRRNYPSQSPTHPPIPPPPPDANRSAETRFAVRCFSAAILCLGLVSWVAARSGRMSTSTSRTSRTRTSTLPAAEIVVMDAKRALCSVNAVYHGLLGCLIMFGAPEGLAIGPSILSMDDVDHFSDRNTQQQQQIFIQRVSGLVVHLSMALWHQYAATML